MSWGATYNWKAGAYENKFESNTDTPEHQKQYLRALKAVDELIATGAFGDPKTKTFRVTFAGHGNPGHEPREGWANDYLYITITQLGEE